jgi:hypothetical protein
MVPRPSLPIKLAGVARKWGALSASGRSFRAQLQGGRTRMRPGSAVMMAPPCSSSPWDSRIRRHEGPCCRARKPTKRRIPECGVPRTTTISPKSLSRVTRILPSREPARGSRRRRGLVPIHRPTRRRARPRSGLRAPAPTHRHRAGPSRTGHQEGFDPLVPDQPLCVDQTGAEIGFLEPRIPASEIVERVASSQHPEHVLNSKSVPTDDGFSTEDLRIDHNSPEKLVLVQSLKLTARDWTSPGQMTGHPLVRLPTSTGNLDLRKHQFHELRERRYRHNASLHPGRNPGSHARRSRPTDLQSARLTARPAALASGRQDLHHHHIAVALVSANGLWHRQ